MNTGAYIYSKLSGTAGVTSLVSTRIYPMLIPQNASLPAVAYSVSNRPLDANAKDRAAAHDVATVTFNIWSDAAFEQDAYSKLDAIDSAIRTALDFVSGTSGGVTCEFCKYVTSEDVMNEERTLLGRVATYQVTIKN
jgi:hypothetical protein